jgi:DNA-binding HxlR family transcriptional regulator
MGKRKSSSTNLQNQRFIAATCDLTYAVCMLAGRWKLLILCHLQEGILRYGEIRHKIPGITERMLTLQLRELENDGLIDRNVYTEFPPHVDYQLTEMAAELVPVWKVLEHWGNRHRKSTNEHVPG